MTTCEYGACRHRSRREQRRCQESLRNQRIVRLNTLIRLAQQELAELMADRYRDIDKLLDETDETDAG